MDLNKFMEDLSSSKPAPGGGSASAVVGIIGSSLGLMVSRLTVGKKGYESNEAELLSIADALEKLASELEKASEEDISAFNGIMSARKMPKSTDEEKNSRRVAMDSAMKEAVRSPWKIASLLRRVMEYNDRLLTVGNTNACTDAGAGILLCEAAIESVLLNVKINLNYIKDSAYLEEQNLKLKLFRQDVHDLSKKSVHKLEALMGGE